MLVKQVQRAVVAAWAPSGTQLVGGSAAQQLDASFNTSAALEIFDLGLTQAQAELQPVASIPSENRFHKLVWGSYNKTSSSGIIIGGCDDGILQIYSAEKLLESKETAILAKPDKHTGAVRALDFNPFQTNLLATGASQSEIYIWDLNNTTTPMTPGTKSQPVENIQWVSWNRQVQHILASTFSSRCVVWDLRKNEPIIKLTDSNGRVSWRVVAWHPDVATQLCLASEDDLAPVIQLWDLRFATAPLKVLENHTRGILSIAWCQQDADLLISCGKDNRILCWNPNTNTPGGEVLSELARTSQWSFEVSWCPKNPALISACSSDGLLSVYSLMGGPSQAQVINSQQQASQILADSFPGMGEYQPPIQTQHHDIIHTDLAKPPKWLKKPVGAKFAFGGKLVSFANEKPTQSIQPNDTLTQSNKRLVYISQVVTEQRLIERSNELENVLRNANFVEYCLSKADLTTSQQRRYVWYFLKSYFDPNPRNEILNLLGYKQDDVYNKLNQYLNKTKTSDVDNVTNQMASLNRGVSSESEDPVLSSDTSADLSPGLEGSGVFDAIGAGNHLDEPKQLPFEININDDSEGLITQALLTGNLELAVEICFENDRIADGLALAMTGGPALIAQAQQRYLKYSSNASLTPIVKALIREDWNPVVENCKPKCWREILVGVLTHTTHHQFPYLIQKLGERLHLSENDDDSAILCYICAGSIHNLVNVWWKTDCNFEDFQELVEVVAILQKGLESQGRQVEISGIFAKLLAQYALLLTAQGNLTPALTFLGVKNDSEEVSNLRDRIYCALGHKQPYQTSYQSNQNQNAYQTSQNNLLNQRKSSYYQSQSQPPQQQTQLRQQPNIFQTNPYNPASATPVPPIQNQPVWMQQNKPPSSPQIPQPVSASYMPQPPKTYSPGPPVASTIPPPRPSSVSSTHGSSGLPKNKYVLDPSVQSSMPSYGNYSSVPGSGISNYNNATIPFNNPMASSNNPLISPTNPMVPGNPLVPANPSALTNPLIPPNPLLHPNNSMVLSNNPLLAPTNPLAPSNQMTPPPPTMKANSLQSNPLFSPSPYSSNMNSIPQNPMVPPMSSNLNILNPSLTQTSTSNPLSYSTSTLSSGSNFETSPNIYTSTTANMNPSNPISQPGVPFLPQSSTPGWNDPPLLNKASKHSKTEFTSPPNPITHPMFSTGTVQDQNNGYPENQPPNSYNPQYGGSGPDPNGYVPQVPSNIPPNAAVPPLFPNPDLNAYQQPPAAAMKTEIAKEVEVPKTKGPIPEEHVHLKTVFDELQTQCSLAANNPQFKRKLDDVKKKLESLYDLLRENKLSTNTLSLLHQMAQMVQRGDYNGGLTVHTQLVSGPDFSQIASFMPGLKVLLQSAIQLQVYLSS